MEADLMGRYDLRLNTELLRSRNLNRVKEFNWLHSDAEHGGILVLKRSEEQINIAQPGTSMDASHGGCLQIFSAPGDELPMGIEYFVYREIGGGKMNVIIIIVVLASLGLLGFVTKSVIAILVGAVGLAVSFLVFCTGVLFGILGKLIAIVFTLAVIGAAVIFVPVALFAIIPGIYFAYLFANKKGYCGSAGGIKMVNNDIKHSNKYC